MVKLFPYYLCGITGEAVIVLNCLIYYVISSVKEEDKIINNIAKQKHEKGDFPVAFQVVCKAGHFLSCCTFLGFFSVIIYFEAPTI